MAQFPRTEPQVIVLAQDMAELASLGHVTRARITQIMNLRLLAPEIQEELLYLPTTRKGRDPLDYHHVRPITTKPDWQTQRQMWKELMLSHS